MTRTSRLPTSSVRAATVGALVSVVALAGCGSDGNSDAAPDAETAAACDAWIAADDAIISFLFTGAGDANSVNAALDTAIDAGGPNAETVSALKTEAQPQLEDPESEASDKTLELYSEAIVWTGENCDVETVEIEAKEYEYTGIPDTLDAGYTVVDFDNVGDELHEMFVFRINEGVTEPVIELLDLPEEEVFSKIMPINAAFADPGESDTTSLNLAEPGKYAMVCFIPVGTTAGAEGDGPSHMMEGMIQEFEVQ
jgi:hypothetical protein